MRGVARSVTKRWADDSNQMERTGFYEVWGAQEQLWEVVMGSKDGKSILRGWHSWGPKKNP